MGNSNSTDAVETASKKQRNHSIVEFDHLMEPALGSSQPLQQQQSSSRSTAQYSPSGTTSDLVANPPDGAGKLNILKKAKESGSFVSKRDILNMGQSNKKLETKADSFITIDQPLRSIPPPSTEGEVVHPAKWLWKHPELTLCMDDHGNTYYYNYNTQESTWDPPADLSLPQAEITFRVTVPEGSRPGEVFTVEVNGTPLEVMCPPDLGPGHVLELSNDTPLYAASAEQNDHVEWRAEDGIVEEEEVREWVNEEDAEAGAALVATTAPPPAVPATVDDDTLWSALAEVAGVDVYSIKSDAELSRTTLMEVANGSYFPELIYRVGWAYKFNLLKSAAAACYLSGGDFLDSSQYDNCDGTPRYENAGFVEWLGDLRSQRTAMEEAIQAGALEHTAQSGDGYALLERLSLGGDEGKLVQGMIARKQQVDRDLDNYRSRVLAIVSVDGGPSREALDGVFSLLKGNVQCGADEEPLDNDEMEEEVSNLLQDRHKFVVDILLTVVLLEEELEALTQSIEEFEARQRASQEKDRSAEGAVQGEEDALRGVADEEAQRLVEQHRAELLQRKEELEQKKAEQLRVLGERLDRTRGVMAFVADLLAEAVRKVSGGDNATAVDVVTLRGMEEALQAEFEEEASAIAAEIAAEERHAALLADEALASSQLILDHERELQKLKASLEEAQELQRAALKERLAKRKADRVKELLEAGSVTTEEAELRAAAEVAVEEEAGRAAIASEAAEKLKQFTDSSLASVRSAADAAAQRLEDSLNSMKSEQQRALMKRLERRRRECERQVEAVAAAGDTLSPALKEAMLASALAKVESASEEEAALLEAQNLAAVRAVRAQMVHLVRSEHEKECERLETELLAQKDKRVKDLKSRLEKKKAERAKEILADSGTTGKGVSSAVAVALANEEVSAEEKQELAAIASETEARMDEARQTVLANLVDLHQKESARLAEDMKYQESMQRANLAHRLERQRQARERELLAAAAVAVTTEATEASLAPSTSDPEAIRQRVEAEMAAVAQREEQALQQALQGLKQQQEKEATQLAEELTYQKTSADKRLKDRLAQRAAKAAQVESPLRTSTGTERPGAPSPLPELELGGRSSPLALAAAVVVTAPAVEEGSLAAEEVLGALKEKHKTLLSRLDLFLQFEKTAVTAQKQSLVRAASTKQKSEAALSDLAKTAILFDHLTEFMALGLKKTLLYETKAVKDAMARFKAEGAASAGGTHRVSAAEVRALQTKDYASAARAEATERVLERFQRDIVGLVDSQATQRRATVAELRGNGSSIAAVQTAMREMNEYHAEAVLNEVEKTLITLAGVWISPESLGEAVAAGGGGDGASTRVAPSRGPGVAEGDRAVGSDDEDEDTELFLSKKRASTIDLNRLKQRSAFGPRLIRWFADLLTLLQLYSSAPAVMLLSFDRSCAQLKFLRLGTNAHLVELSAEVRTRLLKPMLAVLVRSFPPLMIESGSAALPLTSESAAEAAKTAVQASFHSAAMDPTALFAQTQAQHYDATTGKEALCAELFAAYAAALQAYIAKPVLTTAELSKAQEVILPAETPASQSSKRGGEAEARKLKLVQAVSSGADRLKAALREKYRKIGGNDAMLQRELGELDRALQEVADMVSDERIRLDEINADGLVAVVERKAQGEQLGPEDVAEVQREVERQKQAQRAQKDVQRVLQTATESENRLGVALKIEQAKRQQALQNRLLNKKKKKSDY